MNMYRVEERKKCLKNGIMQESCFNLNYLKERVIDNPTYNNFNDIIIYENDIHFLMNTYQKLFESRLDECKLNFLEDRILEQLKYMNNMRYVRSVIENTQSYLQIDLSKLIIEADTLVSADRILSNEARLDEKFDMNEFIKTYNTYSENSIISLIEELCFMIDTFNCDSKLKYNTALENITYSLYSHKINISEELIVETITRFFELTGLDTVSVLESTSVINEKVKHNVLNKLKSKSVSKVKEFINKIKKIKTPQQVKTAIRLLYSQSAKQVIEDTPNVLTWLRTFFMFSTVMINPYLGCVVMLVDQFIALDVKRSEADKMVDKFKAEKEKCEKKLNKLSNEKSIENLEKYIKELDKSIDKLEEYRDSLHSEEEIERSYDDDMEENFVEQNKEYMDILFEGEYGYTPYNMTPQCFVEKYQSEFKSQINTFKRNLKNYSLPNVVKEYVTLKDTNVNILEYLLDNGNIYLPIAEVSNNIPENQFERLRESLMCNINMHYKIIDESITDDKTTLYLLTDYCITEQNVPHKDLVKTFAIIKETENAMNNILENGKISKLFNNRINLVDNDYVRDISSVTNRLFNINNEEVIEFLKETKEELYHQQKVPYALIENYNDAITILKNKSSLDDIIDFINVSECIDNIIDINDEIITEGSITNTLLMAREKLRKNVVKLSDKDKEYSKRIDNSMGNMIEKIQKNLTNKNREAVIKGSILPSASAAIKLGIASGAAALVNPVLSIIVLLGGLGCAKIGTAKEKQYILDEIEIELKLVDKKIQLAERNDDTKALEQLYKIEKQLKREQTRIKYNQKSFRPVNK